MIVNPLNDIILRDSGQWWEVLAALLADASAESHHGGAAHRHGGAEINTEDRRQVEDPSLSTCSEGHGGQSTHYHVPVMTMKAVPQMRKTRAPLCTCDIPGVILNSNRSSAAAIVKQRETPSRAEGEMSSVQVCWRK